MESKDNGLSGPITLIALLLVRAGSLPVHANTNAVGPSSAIRRLAVALVIGYFGPSGPGEL